MTVCVCLCVFFVQQTWRRGRQSRGQETKKEEIKRKEMGTRGSEGVRREVAESERKISRRGS